MTLDPIEVGLALRVFEGVGEACIESGKSGVAVDPHALLVLAGLIASVNVCADGQSLASTLSETEAIALEFLNPHRNEPGRGL